MNNTNTNSWLTAAEAMELLQIQSYNTFKKYRDNNQIPYTKFGLRTYRYPRYEIEHLSQSV